jgi:hypothetical protein
MAFDAFALQHTMKPEAVETCGKRPESNRNPMCSGHRLRCTYTATAKIGDADSAERD